MGAWDVGPFDNDTAADWCGDLNDAAPQERPDLIRRALTGACVPEDTYLDCDEAAEAVAAAAVVASQLPDGPRIDTPYAPDFLLAGDSVEVPDDVRPLALRALDRIAGQNSEWRELWEESERFAEVTAVLQPIRVVLERSGH
jgi:hypothetical protein